jgi:tetratricopeptide (TPR) repeat protein
MVTLTTDEPDSENFVSSDSSGNPIGYLGSKIFYEQTEFDKCMSRINQGIKLFPNRLDMRFGKIYALGQAEDWEEFTSEIMKAIAQSSENNNEWTWTNNEKKGGENFFLSTIQSYQVQLYDTQNDSLLKNVRTIANKVLSYYPNHIESLSNKSVTYLLLDDYENALEPLLKAEKIDPTDYIVLSNIAQAYKLKEDKILAIKYYKKVIEFGDSDSKEYAKQQIVILKE